MKSICSGGFICNLGSCLFSVSLIRSACYLSDTLIPGPQHPECGATSSQAFVNAKLFTAKTIKRENPFFNLAFVEQCCQKVCICLSWLYVMASQWYYRGGGEADVIKCKRCLCLAPLYIPEDFRAG